MDEKGSSAGSRVFVPGIFLLIDLCLVIKWAEMQEARGGQAWGSGNSSLRRLLGQERDQACEGHVGLESWGGVSTGEVGWGSLAWRWYKPWVAWVHLRTVIRRDRSPGQRPGTGQHLRVEQLRRSQQRKMRRNNQQSQGQMRRYI